MCTVLAATCSRLSPLCTSKFCLLCFELCISVHYFRICSITPPPPTPNPQPHNPPTRHQVVNTVSSGEGCTDFDSKMLKLCFKIMHELVRHPRTAEYAISGLDINLLDVYLQTYVPSNSGLALMGTEVCKALANKGRQALEAKSKERKDRPSTVVVECVKERGSTVRSSSALSNSSSQRSRSASFTHDTSVDTSHDLSTATAYESLSSDSSVPSSPFDLAHLTMSFDNDTDCSEGVFSSCSDREGGTRSPDRDGVRSPLPAASPPSNSSWGERDVARTPPSARPLSISPPIPAWGSLPPILLHGFPDSEAATAGLNPRSPGTNTSWTSYTEGEPSPVDPPSPPSNRSFSSS